VTDVLVDEITVLDPRTGEVVGRVPTATRQECEGALGRARWAAGGWARTSADERAAALHAAAGAVREAADELAALNERETGKCWDDARGGVEAGISTLVQYAELGRCIAVAACTAGGRRPTSWCRSRVGWSWR
jgi:acyl-CoA reductase-like NAD-dependent aldehyde dehydrogenase